MEVETGAARDRLDEFRFGPVLDVVRRIRGRVESRSLTTTDVVRLVNEYAQEWVTHEVAGSQRPRVPALLLIADGRWPEFVDALLPDASPEFRADVVEGFHEAVPVVGSAAMARYTGGPEDHRFGPILGNVRRLRGLASSLSAHDIACNIIDLVLDGLSGTERVPALRLFADARWAEFVDAILPASPRPLKELVVTELRDIVRRDKEVWKAKTEKLYAKAGRPDHAGGAVVAHMAQPSLAPSYGVTVMGERIHGINALTQAKLETQRVVSEFKAAQQLSRGATPLQLQQASSTDPVVGLTTPDVVAAVVKLMAKHPRPAVLAAIALELENWVGERDEYDAEDDDRIYIRVARDIRRALEEAT